MAKKIQKPSRQYESIAGQENRIKTEIYQTNPKTIITIEGKIPEEISLELRFIVDGFLKEKGF